MKFLNSLSYILMSCLIFAIMVISPEKTFLSGKNSVEMFLFIILPSLFPFMVLIDLLLQSKFLSIAVAIFEPILRPLFKLPGSASVALICGLLSGYPGGAIMTASLRENRLISKCEAERLISFCNNASPIFITGAVGSGLLNNSSFGLILLKTHILASITVGLIFRFIIPDEKNNLSGNKEANISSQKMSYKDFFTINDITISIYKISRILVVVGAYIILFGVLIQILRELYILELLSSFMAYTINIFTSTSFANESIITLVICGLIEISNGLRMVANEKLPILVTLPIISLILGWGSLSVHFQVLSIIRKTDIRAKIYIFGKTLHGLISAIYTIILLMY